MPGPVKGVPEKAKDFKAAITRMIRELKPFYVPTIVATLFAAIGSIIAIITPNELSDLTDEITKGLTAPMNFEAVWGIVIVVGILFIVSLIFEIIEAFLMTDVSNNFARMLRTRISEKINRLPLRFFDNHQTGDTLSRVTNDVDSVAQSLNESLSTLVSAVTLLVGVIIMMFVTNGIMAITSIVSGLIGFAFVFLVLKRSQKYFSMRDKKDPVKRTPL